MMASTGSAVKTPDDSWGFEGRDFAEADPRNTLEPEPRGM
jgi:hypothetical protein